MIVAPNAGRCAPLLVLALAFGGAGYSQDDTTAPALEVESASVASAQQVLSTKTYRVEMTTRLLIPANGKPVSEVDVWHALPVKRPWSNTAVEVGATAIEFTGPGKQEHHKAHTSSHIVWRQKKAFAPGTALSFTTRYTVRSAEREFDPSSVQTKWTAGFEPPADIEPELARLADDARSKLSPAEAVVEFSKWIRRSMRYDASVPYRSKDVASTLANKRGHCGHNYQVFDQLCRRAGIPVRPVRGLNLFNADGKGKLTNLHSGWTNIHTWAEVYFPEVGWVEVEPYYGAKAFYIPARMIHNNRWFQNYFVWVTEDGKRITPYWTLEDGLYTSEYKTENLITFSEVADATGN